MPRTTTKKTAQEVIEKRSNGFVVVRGSDYSYKWRRSLKTALRDAEKAKDVWGDQIRIFDCETKESVYNYQFLGGSKN